MLIILKNILTALRRYPTAFLLNLAGLSVAFGAFLVILIRVGDVRLGLRRRACHRRRRHGPDRHPAHMAHRQ